MAVSKLTLEELQAKKLPRATWSDLIRITSGEGFSDKEGEELNQYFNHFAKPSSNEFGHSSCLMCSHSLTGLLGTFTWGIRNGEGNCSHCGWPARAFHRDLGPIEFLCIILQYHPEEVAKKEETNPNGTR